MALQTGFPMAPMLDPSGLPSAAWTGFFLALYERTGAGAGLSLASVQSAITTEVQARAAAVTTLTTEVSQTTAAIATETARAKAAETALAAAIAKPAANGALLARMWFLG